MALVKGNVWGHLSGKVGLFSARITSGRTILASRPVSVNTPKDAASVNRRKLFGATLSLAAQVINLPILKKIWDMSKEQFASGHNKIVQVNYGLVSAERPTINCVITPESQFVVPVQNAVVAADKITAEIPALNLHTLLDADEVHCTFAAVICYHTPLAEGDRPYNFVRLSKDVPNYNFAQVYNLQMDLNVLQQGLAAKYDANILYLAIIPKTADERVKQFSATYAKAF